MNCYCGRDFSATEITRIRQLMADHPACHRAELSRQVCRMLQWYKADGGLKEMSCRVAMLRMHADGLIHLPPPRRAKATLRTISFTKATNPRNPILQPVHRLGPLLLRKVERSASLLWNEYIGRYHYLGYTPLPGAQLRYFVMLDLQIIALLGFGAAAWQAAPRDHYIGWTHSLRKRHLPLVVNNARFLILPWVQVNNLASKILSLAAKQVPEDWQKQYEITPVLMETFVETGRFAGTCYKAANWVHVGKTKGRGKLGPSGKQSVPIKDLWLYPLDRNFRKILTT
ncbi:MAG: DUF4338 domain-containing protein [Syntrophaceae bacterium]|jgi:hypothetical protein|nr:DUF4338 domain-containing protein [Syntrophaceae bacterium]